MNGYPAERKKNGLQKSSALVSYCTDRDSQDGLDAVGAAHEVGTNRYAGGPLAFRQGRKTLNAPVSAAKAAATDSS